MGKSGREVKKGVERCREGSERQELTPCLTLSCALNLIKSTKAIFQLNEYLKLEIIKHLSLVAPRHTHTGTHTGTHTLAHTHNYTE